MAPIDENTPASPRESVGQLVAGNAVSVNEKLTLRALAEALSAADIGAALVRRDDGRVGIVSERDVTRALADNADPDAVWAADIMTEELVTADVDEAILQVALRMIDEGIRHIAVVERDEVVGVVSSRAVFRVFAEDALEGW